MNTFKGANLEFDNRGIHYVLAEIIKFRKQLTVRSEFQSQSGWDNGINHYMAKEIEKLRRTISSITYSPNELTQEELEANAADTSRRVADDFGPTSIAYDNVLMPVDVNRQVVWTLDGTDPDIPQMTPVNCPNDTARGFLTLLDTLFVQLTRLDSRHQPQTITKYESVMMTAYLEELYTLTQRKGGEDNRSDIPTGTLPSQDPATFLGNQ